MAVEQAATAGTPGGGGIWPVLAEPLRLRTWTATIYLLASMFVGLAWFTILSVGLALGAASGAVLTATLLGPARCPPRRPQPGGASRS
jgi:hypothetical protein